MLLIFYFAVLSIANDFAHALAEFRRLWPWIFSLAAGFGAQAGLYSFIKTSLRECARGQATGVAAGAGISGLSMAACCAHHLTDILPGVFGLSIASSFLVQYQMPFIYLGVGSNILGILHFLNLIKRHSLFGENKYPFSSSPLLRGREVGVNPMRKLAYIAAAVLLAVLVVSFGWIRVKGPVAEYVNGIRRQAIKSKNNSGAAPVAAPSAPEQSETGAQFETKSNEGGGLSVDAAPVSLSMGYPTQIKLTFNTHQGDLNFNLLMQAALFDDSGRVYRPARWLGEAGGHHLEGSLVFPPLNPGVKKIMLKLFDIYDVKERAFEWNI